MFVDRFGESTAGAQCRGRRPPQRTGSVATVLGLVIARFVLASPRRLISASIKAVEWFLQKERVRDRHFTRTSVGVRCLSHGFRATGASERRVHRIIGMICRILKFFTPLNSNRASASRSSSTSRRSSGRRKAVKVPWTSPLRYCEIAFIIGKFITDPVVLPFHAASYLDERGQNPLTALWIGVIYTGSFVRFWVAGFRAR